MSAAIGWLMNEKDDRLKQSTRRNLSGKTVLIAFGTITAVLMVVWGAVGGWYMALSVLLGIIAFLLVVFLYQAVIWPLFLGALFLLVRLIPKRMRDFMASERKLSPVASALAFGLPIAILVGFFCLTTRDPKGVLIFTAMISFVVGFFALIHRIDVKWQTHRDQLKAANKALDMPSDCAPSASPEAPQD